MKMKIMISGLALFAFAVNAAQATLIYRVVDFEHRTVQLTYEVEDTLINNQVFVFPQVGFEHDDRMGDFQVLSVFDTSTNQELFYRVVRDPDTNNPKLRINYDEPVTPGKRKILRIRVLVNVPAAEMGIEAGRRYFYAYETSHPFEFILPPGEMLVYCNQPMLVFERDDDIVLMNHDTKFRNIVIKTRPIR